MLKRTRTISLIMAVLLVFGMFGGCGKKAEESADNNAVEVKPDDPNWHTNGMEPILRADENGETIMPDPTDPEQKYTIYCRFEGKMDENSFEVTEIGPNQETGEEVDGSILQMRVGNSSVREDINVAEIGENLSVICSYNEDSQLVAERIILLGN